MILMGDEVRRTQYGNNNAYCQNNELSWLDWDLLRKNAEIHRFTRSLIRHRAARRRTDARSRLVRSFALAGVNHLAPGQRNLGGPRDHECVLRVVGIRTPAAAQAAEVA